MITRKLFALATALLALPAGVFAHEGHGHYPASQVLHYLTAPEHIVQTSIVVAAFAGFLLFQGVRSLKKSRQ
jgi:hypothetical protein